MADYISTLARATHVGMHCNRYCLVLDTLLPQRDTRDGVREMVHAIDFVVHEGARGLGHGKRTVHAVIDRILREEPPGSLVTASVAALKAKDPCTGKLTPGRRPKAFCPVSVTIN